MGKGSPKKDSGLDTVLSEVWFKLSSRISRGWTDKKISFSLLQAPRRARANFGLKTLTFRLKRNRVPFCLFLMVFVCWCPDRDSGDFLLLLRFLQSMGADDGSKGDGFQRQKRKGCMVGYVRKKLLAKAINIDGRTEWHCLFCSVTNVWTRSKTRRCKTGIPSVLQGKQLQAVVAAGLSRCPRPMERIKCWPKKSPVGEGDKITRIARSNSCWRLEGRQPSVQFDEASKEIKCEEDEKRRWTVSRTARKSWINEMKIVSSKCERSTQSHIFLRTIC